MWIKVFTYSSVSKKPSAARMGKGKGSHSYWICPIRSGQIIYEVGGVPTDLSLKALKSAGTKLPLKTSIVKLVY
jgi:large subunit ribosomal protein L16